MSVCYQHKPSPVIAKRLASIYMLQSPPHGQDAERWLAALQQNEDWQHVASVPITGWLEIIALWQKRAQQLASQKRLSDAKGIAAIMRRLGSRLHSVHVQAYAEWTLGNCHTIRLQALQAISHYRRAQALYETVNDERNLARMTVGMVAAMIRADQFAEARMMVEFAYPILEHSAEPADQKRFAGLANNAAVVYQHFADYEAAISLYEKKIKIYEKRDTDPHALIEIARTQLNLGVLQTKLNLWEEAEESFRSSQLRFDSAEFDPRYRFDLERLRFQHVALISQREPDAPHIQNLFNEARDALTDLNNRLSLAIVEARWNLQRGATSAEFYAHLSDLRGDLAKTDVHARGTVQVDLLLASLRSLQPNPEVAVDKFQSLLTQADASIDWEMRFEILHRLGETYQRLTQEQAAQSAFEEAITLLESINQELTSSHLRTGFMDDKLVVYQDLARLRLTQRDVNGAINWVERGRGRELMQLLARDLTGNQYAQIDLDHLTTQIPSDTLILCYFNLRDELWLLPLTHTHLSEPIRLGAGLDAAKIKAGLARIHSLTRYPPNLVARHAPRLTATAQQVLADWYTRYLFPAHDLLAGVEKVIIIPSDVLHYVPLHASYDTGSGRYFVESHAVHYAPSLSAWLAARDDSLSITPSFDITDATSGLALSYAGDTLQHTNAEIDTVVAAFPQFAAYLDKAATRARVLEGAGPVDLLHIAAHAVFRADNPRLSYIQLFDERLTTVDVMEMSLQAQLVTLSACETGRGLLRGGEYLGLVWAFLAAGARAVLATHWRVDDYATASLMRTFYDSLQRGTSAPQALRAAQLGLISAENIQYQHPYYWAPFYIYGNPDYGSRRKATEVATPAALRATS